MHKDDAGGSVSVAEPGTEQSVASMYSILISTSSEEG